MYQHGQLWFLGADGSAVEIINHARTTAYLSGVTFDNGVSVCDVLADGGCAAYAYDPPCGTESEDWTPLVFTSPAGDDAPWYSTLYPESGDAFGFWIEDWTGLDDAHIVRPTTPIGGSWGGSQLGVIRANERVMKLNVILFARNEEAIEYLFRWLAGVLSSVCSTCALDSIMLRRICPTLSGDVALLAAPTTFSTVFYDDFDRASGPLGSNWTPALAGPTPPGTAPAMPEISFARAVDLESTTGTGRCAFYSTPIIGDHTADVRILSMNGGSNRVGVLVNFDLATFTGVEWGFVTQISAPVGTEGNLYRRLWTNGSFANITSTHIVNPGALRVEVTGSNYKSYYQAVGSSDWILDDEFDDDAGDFTGTYSGMRAEWGTSAGASPHIDWFMVSANVVAPLVPPASELWNGMVRLDEVGLVEGVHWESDPTTQSMCSVRRVSFGLTAGDPCMYLGNGDPVAASSEADALVCINSLGAAISGERSPCRPSCVELGDICRGITTIEIPPSIGSMSPVVRLDNDNDEHSLACRLICYADPAGVGVSPNPCGLPILGELYVRPLPPWSSLVWDVCGRKVTYRDASTGTFVSGAAFIDPNDRPLRRYFVAPCGQIHVVLELASVCYDFFTTGITDGSLDYFDPHFPAVSMTLGERISCV